MQGLTWRFQFIFFFFFKFWARTFEQNYFLYNWSQSFLAPIVLLGARAFQLYCTINFTQNYTIFQQLKNCQKKLGTSGQYPCLDALIRTEIICQIDQSSHQVNLQNQSSSNTIGVNPSKSSIKKIRAVKALGVILELVQNWSRLSISAVYIIIQDHE